MAFCKKSLTEYIFHARIAVYSTALGAENCRAARRSRGETSDDTTRRDGILKVDLIIKRLIFMS